MAAALGITRRMGLPERAFAGVAAVLMAVAAAFWSASASMVSVWDSSGTYSHGFFIVPAFLWLVWKRRQALADLPVRPSGSALPVVALLGAIGVLGHWMGLSLPTHVAAVAMVPAMIAGVFGLAWVRALAFPLVFLFFAVPAGDALVPILMDWTADFTVAALRLSGVPVYRDGLHFEIPNGRWSVVESCSGIRYLFACLAVASLYSWTIYRRTARRLLFIGLAAAIAIVANWLRAYAIVLLGHLSDNRIATGADHLVYGALFFAFIMALVFALGSAWREDETAAGAEPDRAPTIAAGPRPAGGGSPRAHAAVATAAIASLLVCAALLSAAARSSGAAATVAVEIVPGSGWSPLDAALPTWRPELNNPTAERSQSFVDGAQAVGVHVGLFGRPTASSKLTSSLNRLLKPDGLDPDWKLAWQGTAQTQWGGHATDVRAAVLVGHGRRLRIWQWYSVDGAATAQPIRAAAWQLLARLRGRGEVSAWVAVCALETDDRPADATLQRFVAGLSINPVSRAP